MEYLDGRPLNEVIHPIGLAAELVTKYGAQIANALTHAHEKRIVHRDLKSANVMVLPEERVKVLDFGLARRDPVMDEATRSHISLTEAGMVSGTLPYMAPEVLRGKTADARSDI